MTFRDNVILTTTLARTLAAQDALHLPVRNPDMACWAAIHQARADFRQQGLPWRSRSGSDAEAKLAERTIATLTARGLLRRHRARTKTTALSLTPCGDATARALCDLQPIDTALTALPTLANHQVASVDHEGWVREIDLNGGRGWGDDQGPSLLLVALALAPLTARGFVESNCDRDGRAYYRLTPAGRRLAAGKTTLDTFAGLPARDEACFDVYWAELDAAHAALRGLPQPPREIGPCPLPAFLSAADNALAGGPLDLAADKPAKPRRKKAAAKG